MRIILSAAAVVLLAGLNSQASAQTPEQFYGGKSSISSSAIRPAAPTTSGRGCIARHIGKHIPGKPNVIPRNLPGAGSFLAVNTVYNVCPRTAR